MFALLSTRFRRLLVFMIAVPLGGRALEAVGRRVERSSGPTRLARSLQAGGRAASRYSRGPLRPRNRVKNGNEDLCNPPGRGLGPTDTTQTGFPSADAFLWTHPPGNSSGCGGGPPGGVFWPARAITLAANANQRLGPGFPSRPY